MADDDANSDMCLVHQLLSTVQYTLCALPNRIVNKRR